MKQFFVVLLALIFLSGNSPAVSTLLCSYTAASGSAITSYAVGGECTFTRNTISAAGQAVVSNANRYRANGTTGSVDWVSNFTPGSSDYWVQADVTFFSFPNATGNDIGIGVRTGTTAFTGYYLLVRSVTSSTIKIQILRAGNATAISTSPTFAAPAANSVYRIRLGIYNGNTPTLTASYQDVTSGTNTVVNFLPPATPAGADIITSTGVVSTYSTGLTSFISDSTGFHLDNLKMNDAISHIAPATTNLWDNRYDNSTTPHWSPYSSLHVQTDASALVVTGISTIYSASNGPAFAQLGARVDGVNQQVLQFNAQATSQNFDVPSSGTTSVYEIVNGGAAKPSSTLLENYFTDTVYMGYTTLSTLTQPTTISRAVALVDSISGCANATFPGIRGYAMQLKYGNINTFQSYTMEGWGSNAFFDQAPDATGETNYVTRLMSFYGPATTELLFFIGGNDYLLNKQTAANFQTRLSGFVGKYHTANPNCKIYIVGFPHLYQGEGNNAGGDPASAYRTAGSTVAAANPTYCTYFDTSGYPYTASMADTDNIHPLSVGHDVFHHGFTIDFGYYSKFTTQTGNTNFLTGKTTVLKP